MRNIKHPNAYRVAQAVSSTTGESMTRIGGEAHSGRNAREAPRPHDELFDDNGLPK